MENFLYAMIGFACVLGAGISFTMAICLSKPEKDEPLHMRVRKFKLQETNENLERK